MARADAKYLNSDKWYKVVTHRKEVFILYIFFSFRCDQIIKINVDIEAEDARGLEKLFNALSISPLVQGIITPTNGIPNVVKIDLRERNLKGKIHDSIACFPKLQYLNLEYNEITGAPTFGK